MGSAFRQCFCDAGPRGSCGSVGPVQRPHHRTVRFFLQCGCTAFGNAPGILVLLRRCVPDRHRIPGKVRPRAPGGRGLLRSGAGDHHRHACGSHGQTLPGYDRRCGSGRQHILAELHPRTSGPLLVLPAADIRIAGGHRLRRRLGDHVRLLGTHDLRLLLSGGA